MLVQLEILNNLLKKSNILKEERAGNVVLYSLNLSSHKTMTYTGFVLEYLSWNKKYIQFF